MIFSKIPISVLRDSRLTLWDLKTYGALSSFLGNKRNCFPSLKKLAERSGLHTVNISKSLHRLQEVGLLKITRRGKTLSNVYELVFPKSELADSAKSQLKSELVDSANVIKRIPLNHSKTESKKNPSKQAGNAKNEAKKSDLNFRKEHLKEHRVVKLDVGLVSSIFNELKNKPENRIFTDTQLWFRAEDLASQEKNLEVVNES